MADYALVGVTSVRDRKRLFQLIQSLHSNSHFDAAASAALPPLTSEHTASPFARTIGSPSELALLFSPAAARSVDAFDAEKDRALALMDEIDLKYGTSKDSGRTPSPASTSAGAGSKGEHQPQHRARALKQASASSRTLPVASPPIVVKQLPAVQQPFPTTENAPANKDRPDFVRSKSLKTVSTTKRAAARAAANKQSQSPNAAADESPVAAPIMTSAAPTQSSSSNISSSSSSSSSSNGSKSATAPAATVAPTPLPTTLPLASMEPEVARALQHKIRVCVRKRPLNAKERRANESDIVSSDSDDNVLSVHEPKLKLDLTPYTEEHSFQFDEVFDESVDNEEVYRATARPLVAAIFSGARATCFAYGQTGSGKTHTMLGDGERNLGLYVLAARDLFAQLNKLGGGNVCTVSFFEIYGGKLFDLLANRAPCHARDNGQGEVVIRGLSSHVVASEHALLDCVRQGSESRSTGVTAANSDSSRSHAVLQLTVGKKDKPLGKLSFIDLAGSERGSETGKNLDKQTRLEGAEINKSLLALKECIRALDQDSRHLPFRQSTLTQVLKDSFVGGITRTVMIATVSPGSGASEHTLNTLRYADRVKELGTGGNKNSESYAALTAAPTVVPVAKLADQSAPKEQAPAAPTPKVQQQQQQQQAADETPAKQHRKRVSLTPRKLLNRKSSVGSAVAAQPNFSGVTPARAASNSALPQVTPRSAARPVAAAAAPDAHEDESGASVLIEALSDVVVTHRRTIDEDMALLKREMKLLDAAIDKSADPQIELYVQQLDDILELKAAAVLQMRERLDAFKSEFMN
jgi:kinesin family protein 2/24